jgi:hypothetical protein
MTRPTQTQAPPVQINIDSSRQTLPPTQSRLAFAAFSLLSLATMIGCATYHVGNQYLYRSDIRTIHVPVFESDSYRRFLGQRLTEAVVKEIELSSPLVITERQLAHSFLRGRILSDIKTPRGETINDDVRVMETAWRVEVTWTDRAGVPLMDRQVLTINRQATFIPEGGQSLSTAQQAIIERLARDIVSQMEQPF